MIRFFFRRRRRVTPGIDPDVIFMDSRNLPEFDTQQFEGRIEKPISKFAIAALFSASLLVMLLFLNKVWSLQIAQGASLRTISMENSLRSTPLFAPRGIIYDRRQTPLAYNENGVRTYAEISGLAHIVGYVSLPTDQDIKRGAYPQEYLGRDGLERTFNKLLTGTHGLRIEETDVKGNIRSSSMLREPVAGENITTSIDARVQTKLYELIASLAKDKGFSGGAGALMDVETGELIALTSYPEYSSSILTLGKDRVEIARILSAGNTPFLNRAIGGLYAPGSIVKPFMAVAALEEKVISPDTKILSTGALTLPNPFNPKAPSIFKDWKAHGYVNMREALAVSSDVYFYEVGGGFGSQRGLGINLIDQYFTRFGFSKATGVDLPSEELGLIPTPLWKERTFDGEKWNIGDTYHTSIGQYGMQITPLQAVRAIAAIANNGRLVEPHVRTRGTELPQVGTPLNFSPTSLQIVREGMHMGVLLGTGKGLNIEGLDVVAKTGTAELGTAKEKVNSWVIGFFPYKHPRYAFGVVMERGDSHNTIGGVFVMRQLLDWMKIYTPEYTKEV